MDYKFTLGKTKYFEFEVVDPGLFDKNHHGAGVYKYVKEGGAKIFNLEGNFFGKKGSTGFVYQQDGGRWVVVNSKGEHVYLLWNPCYMVDCGAIKLTKVV